MDYHIVFTPDLNMNLQDFIAAWNETPDSRALAEAQLDTQPLQSFSFDPQVLHQGLILLSGVAGFAGGVALDVLKDMVKDKLTEYLQQKLSRKPVIKVDAIRQPGGAYLLIVKEGEHDPHQHP